MSVRRILTVLVCAAMVLSTVSTVRADAPQTHCVCGSSGSEHLPGCDGSQKEWTPWTQTDSLPTSGYYYLGADVTVSARTTVSGALFLNLNGHTISSSSPTGVFLLSNAVRSLTLLDTAGGGRIDIAASITGGSAFVFMANAADKSFTLYGGTCDASGTDFGDGIGVIRTQGAGNCTVNIHGGSIVGGTGTAGKAGCVFFGATGTSTLNMTGGSISGGTAKQHGGNVYLNSTSSMNISGGSISGGTAETGQGGNVFSTGAVISMTGGEISGGTAFRGGNVSSTGSAVMTMTGGSIYGGTASEHGGNVNSNGSLTVSGAARIFDGEAVLGPNINISGGSVSVAEGCAYFTSGDGTGIYPASSHKHCVCGHPSEHLSGCDGAAVNWSSWTDQTTLPDRPGYYCLDADVTVSATVEVNTSGEIFLDLNGHTVTSQTRITLPRA